MSATCGVCNSDRLEEIEALCQQTTDFGGNLSWREVARKLEWSHHTPLKNHMAKHWVAEASPTQLATAEFEDLIADNIRELSVQLRLAPPEVKPFYAIAIQNLTGLASTKPSQANLVAALKAIHEVTGMKMEQRLMFEFARAAFPGAQPNPTQLAPVIDVLALEEGDDDDS